MVNSCQAGKQERMSAGKTRTCLRPGAKIRGKAWPWPIQCQFAPGSKNRRLGTRLLSSLSTAVFPTEIIRRMGTSFECSDSFNHLGGQKLVMIGRWYSRQPFTNQNECLSNQTIPKTFAPKNCIRSPGLTVSVLTWGGKKICLVWGTKKLLVVHTIRHGTEISSCSKGRKRM